MAQAMRGVTRALMSMNSSMNLPAMQKVMMEFERQSEMMDMKEEMMEDTMDGMLGEDEEGESDEILSQVLDEIGIGLSSQVKHQQLALGDSFQSKCSDFEKKKNSW